MPPEQDGGTAGDVSVTGNVSSWLVDQFLGPGNRPKIAALGSAIGGGGLYAVLLSVSNTALSFGEAVKLLVGGIIGATDRYVGQFLAGLLAELGLTWDPFQFGLFSLPANALVVLVAFSVLVLGVNYLVD